MLKAIKLSTLIFIGILVEYLMLSYQNGLLNQVSQNTIILILMQFVLLSLTLLNFIFTHIESAEIQYALLNNVKGSKTIHVKLWNLGKTLALIKACDSRSIETFRKTIDGKDVADDLTLIEVYPQQTLEFKIILNDSHLAKNVRLFYRDNIGKHSILIKRS